MSSILRIRNRNSGEMTDTVPEWERSRSRIYRGIFLILGGILSIIYSIQPVMGFERIYFYFSFWHVTPELAPAGKPGSIYSIPAVVNTYEVLVPWLLIGVSLLIYGAWGILTGTGYIKTGSKNSRTRGPN